mgnify:CR=1 FL=1
MEIQTASIGFDTSMPAVLCVGMDSVYFAAGVSFTPSFVLTRGVTSTTSEAV